jgi:hypothetical protein
VLNLVLEYDRSLVPNLVLEYDRSLVPNLVLKIKSKLVHQTFKFPSACALIKASMFCSNPNSDSNLPPAVHVRVLYFWLRENHGHWNS